MKNELEKIILKSDKKEIKPIDLWKTKMSIEKEKSFLNKLTNKTISLKLKPYTYSVDSVFKNIDDIIPVNKTVTFYTNSFEEIIWKEINSIALMAFEKFLKESGNMETKISSEISELGFNIEFSSKTNISTNQFALFEGKVLKILDSFIFKSFIKPKDIKIFKLLNVSGIEINNDKLKGNKIFGLATFDLVDLNIIEEEIKNKLNSDHRKISKELEIFHSSDEMGRGLITWLPNGLILKNLIKNYIGDVVKNYDYFDIETPIVANTELFITSEHYSHYKESMFPEMINQEKERFLLRPMACPHHILFYKMKPRSYKELPFRVSEFAKQYRYESSGSLLGLERVRGMELTDGHIFLTENQLEKEIENIFNLIQEVIKKFDIKIEFIELALHDPKNREKYHSDSKMWQKSEKILEGFLKSKKIKYVAKKGEAAFYGPKIDIQIKTTLGRIVTLSTIQLDFLLPEKFDLNYTTDKNNLKRPIMIHRGIIGTFERFVAILLEQSKGVLPFWLSPKQVIIIPVSKSQESFAKEINNYLKKFNFRSEVDLRDERLSYKLRDAITSKTKIQVILGEKEMKENNISFRTYGSEQTTSLSIEEFILYLAEINN